MMTYTHLFWDFDGTLYNSYPQIILAMEKALADAGLPPQPEGSILKLFKLTMTKAFVYYAPLCGLDTDQLHALFHAHHQRVGFFPPYEGLKECLTRLSNAGARHYLYTHRDGRAWEHLEKDGLRPLFTDGVTSEDGFPHKPAPDALRHLIAKHGLDPAHCAMIGDRDIDILSGQNAGMAGILFDPDGFYPSLKVEGRAGNMDELCRVLLTM